MTPTEFYRDDQCIVATWKNVVITVFAGAPQAAQVHQVEAAARDVLRRSNKVLMLVRLGAFSKPPEREARDQISAMAVEFAGRSDGWALVIEAGGFLAAALRSVAAGMAMVSNRGVAQKPFKSVEGGARWLSLLDVAAGFSEPELTRAVEAVGFPAGAHQSERPRV